MFKEKMTKVSGVLDCFFRYTVLTLFGIFIFYLLVVSLFTTNYSFVGRKIIFESDSPWKVLAVLVLFVGIIFMARRWGAADLYQKYREQLHRGVNLLLLLFMLFLIVATQLRPHGDQLAISDAAVGLRTNDFELFVDGSYFVYWPFQSRIVVFLWGFFKIFGNWNYPAFQIMNAFCILISLNLLAKIAVRTGVLEGKNGETLGFLGCALFLPYLFYVTFIYGNIVGLMFMIAAIYMLIRYVQEHRLRYLTGVIVFCAIGVWLKNTYLILMVAILVFLLVDFWQEWKIVNLAGMLCVVAAVTLLGNLSDALIERRLGFPLTDGSPMIAWITMAFGEDEEGNPVKFDAYNRDVYLENDLDTEKAEKEAKEELKKRLTDLMEDPMHMMDFMRKKIAIAWNEPTHESLVANNRPETGIEQSGLTRFILREDEKSPIVEYMNLFHGMLLAGVLIWIIRKGRAVSIYGLLPAVVFIGGFLFQLFWETYSQYTIQYFLLIIPYAVSGFAEIMERLEQRFANVKDL